MARFILLRLLQTLCVLAVMSFVIYGLIGLMPGDPINLMLAADPHLTSADVARLKALYGLDQPLLKRYIAWAGAALSGNFGYSRLYATSAIAALAPRLANTALLMGASFVLSLAVARLKALYGLDQPLLKRYIAWAGAALSGNFGYSRLYATTAIAALAPRLANTALLMGLSFVLSLAVALPLGALAARRPGSALDLCANLLSFAGISVPPFWLALMLILVFAVALGWLPPGGIATIGDGGILDRARHLVLPVSVLTLASIGTYLRYMRAGMIEALRQDYIRTARAKGASEARVLWGHALRNALIPVITVVALSFGSLFSGALVTETMFAYPGMGKLIYDAILGNDFNVALAGLLFATLLVLLSNLAADIAYAAADPRISLR